MEHKNQSRTWFVTGASKGLGKALVQQLLDSGQQVAATTRQIASFDAQFTNHGNFLALEVDLSSRQSIFSAVAAAQAHFGKVDVLVNNAGYGIGGSLEELSESEIKQAFDINLFATIHTIAAVLPGMRSNKTGHIINISSIAGFHPGTGWAAYAAVKSAVFGLTESLAGDVAEFGIKATVVAPGAFRTDFLTTASLVLSANEIPEYTAIRQSHARTMSIDGKQAGDPVKAADAIMNVASMENPPVHLFLGSDAYKRALLKIAQVSAELETYEKLSISTDY